MIAKSLQNLSNNVFFGVKEQYLNPINKFIEKNISKLTEKFESICSNENENMGTPTVCHIPTQLKDKSLDIIYKYILLGKTKVFSFLSKQNPSLLSSLERVISVIKVPPSINKALKERDQARNKAPLKQEYKK